MFEKVIMRRRAFWRGRLMELHAGQFFPGGKDRNKERVSKKGHDLDWNGYKIDIKSSQLIQGSSKGSRRFNFRGNKYTPETADYYFCIGIIDNVPTRYYLIPKEAFGKRVCVNPYGKSKYKKYEVTNPLAQGEGFLSQF